MSGWSINTTDSMTYRNRVHRVLYRGLLLHLLRLDRCDSSLEAQLQLSLSSTNECLERLGVALVEADVAASGIGISLEDDGLLWLDIKHLAEL